MMTPFRDFWRLLATAHSDMLQAWLARSRFCRNRIILKLRSDGLLPNRSNESSHPQDGAVKKPRGAWIGSPGCAVLKLLPVDVWMCSAARAYVHVCSGRMMSLMDVTSCVFIKLENSSRFETLNFSSICQRHWSAAVGEKIGRWIAVAEKGGLADWWSLRHWFAFMLTLQQCTPMTHITQRWRKN